MRTPILYIAVLLLTAVAMVAGCGSNGADMRAQLEELERCNRADSLMTNDSLALVLTDYFDRHGTPNEQMRAYYILGRTYFDRGEMPAALEAYHAAADRADTTRADCDYRTLCRVHAQTAELLIYQETPNNSLIEYEKARKYAHIAKDTLVELVSYEHEASAYKILNIIDSAIIIRETVSKLYDKYNYPKYAAEALMPVIDILMDRADYKKAKAYLDKYEAEFGLEDSEYNQNRLYRTYFFHKGRFYLHTAKLDSAEYFFRKEISTSNLMNDMETGYRGLYLLYQKKNNPDSIAKYAVLSYEMNDSAYRELSTWYFQQAQAMYDYSCSQRLAEKKTLEANEARAYLAVTIAILVIVLLCTIIIYMHIRRKQERLAEKMLQLQEQYNALQLAKTKLDMLSKNKDLSLHEKQEYIKDLEQRIKLFAETEGLEEIANKENSIINSLLVGKLSDSITNPNIIFTRDDWYELQSLVQLHLPGFISKLRTKYPNIREEEFRLCLLIRIHFALKDIASILGLSLQNVNNMRRRLMEKIFKEKGNAKQFDAQLLKLH